jgi:hypothetical protein
MALKPRFQAQFQQPFAEQIAFFRRKLNLPTEWWDDIQKSANDRVFIVAGAAKAGLLDDLQRSILTRMDAGEGLDAFRRDFKKIVEQQGWHDWTGEGTKKGEAWRTRVIYETNLRTSYAAGRYQQLKNPDLLDVAPYWQYVHSGKEHYRPEHKAWGDERLTLPHDHPFWDSHYPPNGYGCGCTVTAVVAPRSGATTEPPDGWDVPNPKTGTPPGIDTGWDYAPGAAQTTPLADLVEQKLFNLDSHIGAAMWESLAPAIEMEQTLKWTGTIDAWLSDPVTRGRQAIVGALTPRIIDQLTKRSLPIPKTAEIGIEDRLVVGKKQGRHQMAQNALSAVEWRQLPGMLRRAERIYIDTHSRKLVFVGDGATAAEKIVVEFDPAKLKKAGINKISTAFRVSEDDVNSAVKGGLWEVL